MKKRDRELVEKLHQEFQAWHFGIFGFYANSRSTEPGYENHYEHPFTNGAWKTWLVLKYAIPPGYQKTESDLVDAAIAVMKKSKTP